MQLGHIHLKYRTQIRAKMLFMQAIWRYQHNVVQYPII